MHSRRHVLSGAFAVAAARFLPGAEPACAAPADLEGVRFWPGKSPEGRRLSGVFNYFTRKTPEIRAECSTTQGVANAVRWARDNGQDFAVHSTGHCFAGHSMHEGLVIGTSSLKNIEVDSTRNRVTTGPGAFIGNVYLKLANSRQALGGGSYYSVGVAGLALGGGIGFRSRTSGLLCDQLERITLVDAFGRIVTATEGQNPDLFWACRGGGGGSFGIVTEMVFRTADVPRRTIIHAHIATSRTQAERITHDWQFWSEAQGRATSTHLFVVRRRANDYLVGLTGEAENTPEHTFRQVQELFGTAATIHPNWIANYYSERGLRLVKNADDLIEPVAILSKSDYIARPIAREGIRSVFDAIERAPGLVKLTIEALGGAVADTVTDATAYPHRAAAYVIELRANPPNIFRLEESRASIDMVKAAYEPYATGGVYVNYPYPTLENWAEAYWGANLPRLMAIKRKWDPENVFHHAQSVPLG